MTTAKNVKNLKVASKNSVKKLVAENEANNIVNNSKKIVSDAELLSKLDSINLDSVINKTAKKQLLWKKEVLQSYKTEKTGRRILRGLQLNLSKSVIRYAKTGQKNDLDNAKEQLNDFYKTNLVDIKNYSNISEDSDKFAIIQLAYKFTFNAK